MRLSAIRRRGGKAWVWMLFGLLLGGAVGAGTMWALKRGQEGKTIPGGPRLGEATELAYVPPDSIGFVHVRIRDIWKSEHLAEVRNIVDKAGADALADLDSAFVPAPSSLDRVTVVFLKSGGPDPKAGGGRIAPGLGLPFDLPSGDFGDIVVMLAFNAKFDAAQVRRSLLPNADRKTSGNGKDYFVDVPERLGVFFPSDTVMVLGDPNAVERFTNKQPKDGKHPEGPLSDALTLAAEGGRHLVAGVNIKELGIVNAKTFERLPPDVLEVAEQIKAIGKAETVTIGVAMTKEEVKLDIRAGYANDADASAAMDAVKPLADFARKKLEEPKKKMRDELKAVGEVRPRPIKELPEAVMSLFALGALNKLDEYLANPPVKRDGKQLVAEFELPGISGLFMGSAAVAVGMLLPAVSKVRDAAARMQGSNNLKQIGIAMHVHNDNNDRLPRAGFAVPPKNAPPGSGLSWRVHILPYIEQDNLYRQFNLNESWDSPTNSRLIDQMPKTYVCPSAAAPAGQTYYKVFVGNGAMFDAQFGHRLSAITDGTSNTIMVIEGGQPVIWTKPDDIPFNPNLPLPDLKLMGNPRVMVLMGDGSVRSIDVSRMTERNLKNAINRQDGEAVDFDGDIGGRPGIGVPKAPDPFPNPKGGPIPFPKGGIPPLPKGGIPPEPFPEK